jgi:hypothetical protein
VKSELKMKSDLKVKRRQKKGSRKKNDFLCMRFYRVRKKIYNKNCLLDTKFFEFKVKSYSPFFLVANNLSTLHRGAFCLFPFQWIYYYGSNESIGKETGKTHLCALCRKCPVKIAG